MWEPLHLSPEGTPSWRGHPSFKALPATWPEQFS